ncbi:MAG: ribonuclease D [Alphaproteobacteria bacterium]
MMKPIYIDQQAQLETLCGTILSTRPKYLSVDTEFFRKTTYWPKLCLIQLAFDDQIVLIDPLPQKLDLSPLKDLFLDSQILKIFHAARQDLEVFHLMWGQVPSPIADTQILAMVCGFGDSISYDKLSEGIVGKKVDKSQQHTDWAQRPLSPKQITYAMGDVENLQEIYEKLVERAGSKIEYIQDELDILNNPDTYQTSFDKAWLKIKTFFHSSPALLGMLKELAAVRERYAQSQNVPRSHLIKDEILVKLASKTKLTPEDLSTNGITNPQIQSAFMEAAEKASPLKTNGDFRPKPNGTLMDILSVFLKAQAETHGIAPKLIANRDRLEDFVHNPSTSPLMQGWRLSLFGERALKIKEGKVALAFDPKTQQPVFVDISIS